MAATEFANLVAAVVEGMGQRPDAVRGTPDGLLLRTTDGFLFAFVEDPGRLSLAGVERLLTDPAAASGRLVVLTPGRLPLALAQRLTVARGSLVEHERFRELLRGLDLGAMLGEEPRGPHDRPGPRLLPSARHLDAVVARARTWLEWGVPALGLRFYRQALADKPGFVPARIGVGRCLAALGLEEEAMATFREILAQHPGDPETRLAEAAVHATARRPAEELRIYRELLADHPDRVDIRAQLIAAAIDASRWAEARPEIETMLAATPEDPRLRFLHSAALAQAGDGGGAEAELRRARRLGLDEGSEASLRSHLGLPPAEPSARSEAPPAPAPARSRRASRNDRTPSAEARPAGRRRAPRKRN